MNEKIIHILKSHKDFVSGEEISRTLKISRAAIWKYIEDFRRQGYSIEALPRHGYRLLASPDKFFPWEISYDLGTKVMGKNIICRDRTSSTMDEAFQLGFQGMPEGTTVLAETQTKGRGRLGRSWVSPPGKGIYLSVILRPPLSLRDVPRMTLLSAVALCETIGRETSLPARIKWPNDILINGRKAAGILTELSAEADRVNFLVVGIGLNVNTAAGHLPAAATSLKIETKKKFSRTDLVKSFLRSLEEWCAVLKRDGFVPVLARWRELAVAWGQPVTFLEGGQTISGQAMDLADDGGLLIKLNNGEIIKKMAGDVIFAATARPCG